MIFADIKKAEKQVLGSPKDVLDDLLFLLQNLGLAINANNIDGKAQKTINIYKTILGTAVENMFEDVETFNAKIKVAKMALNEALNEKKV